MKRSAAAAAAFLLTSPTAGESLTNLTASAVFLLADLAAAAAAFLLTSPTVDASLADLAAAALLCSIVLPTVSLPSYTSLPDPTPSRPHCGVSSAEMLFFASIGPTLEQLAKTKQPYFLISLRFSVCAHPKEKKS
jgi:hypothetical protein